MALDLYLLQKLNNLPNQSIFWQKSFIFCADYLIYIIFGAVVLWGLVSFLLKYKESRKKILEMILLAAVSGITARFIIAEIIRFFYNRPRPFESLESVRQLVDHASGNSFPSGSFFYNKGENFDKRF